MLESSPSTWTVFLDRDGVINKEMGAIADADHLQLVDGSASAIARLNSAGALVIVATNQAAVARGLATEEDLAVIHARLKELLAGSGARLDDIFYCPHLAPPFDEPGAVARYVVNCDCRKPKTGLLEQARRKYAIDKSRAFFVGDSARDIEAAKLFGCRAVLVRTGHGGRDQNSKVRPDAVFDDLTGAVDWILNERRVP
jgi:histidinol-phosphate phosphatase family protein